MSSDHRLSIDAGQVTMSVRQGLAVIVGLLTITIALYTAGMSRLDRIGDDIADRIEQTNDRIDGIASRQTTLSGEVSGLRVELASSQSQFATREDLADSNARMSALFDRVAELRALMLRGSDMEAHR